MKKIGEIIKSHRRMKGLSQQEMGDRLEISRVSYVRIETGKTDVTYSRLLQIAKILEVSVQELVGLPETAKQANDSKKSADQESQIIKLQQKIIELMENDKKGKK